MVKTMLSAAVIGAGKMGSYHAAIYQSLPNIRLLALSVTKPENARLKKEQFNVPVYTSYEKLLAEVKPDLVSIAAPTVFHMEIAVKCLEAGCHVLLEKPIAECSANAQKIIEAAGKSGKKLMVGHIERFNPVIVEAKKLLLKKIIGNILAVTAVRAGLRPQSATTDVLLDLGIHDFDLFAYLTGEQIMKAKGFKKRFAGQFTDWVSLTCVGSSAIFEYHTDWLRSVPQRQMHFIGDTGELFLDFQAKRLILTHKNTKESKEIAIDKSVNPLANEIESFVDSCISANAVSITGADGLNALKAYEMAIKSAREI